VFLYTTLFAALRPAADTVVAPAVSASRIVNEVEPLFVYTSLLSVNVLAPVPPNEILSIPEMLLKSDAATVVVAFSSNKLEIFDLLFALNQRAPYLCQFQDQYSPSCSLCIDSRARLMG
jgi:hypothetical protein